MNGKLGEHTALQGIRGLAHRVCRYFLDFLETDFKRQQAPRRKIESHADGGRASLNLRKYRTLYAEVWKLAGKPLKTANTLRVKRGAHTAPLSPILQSLIVQHVQAIEPRLFAETIAAALGHAERTRGAAANDIERYAEGVVEALAQSLDQKVVAPLLSLLDAQVRAQAYSAEDSIYEIETDVVEALVARAADELRSELPAYVLSGDRAPLEARLKEWLDPDDSKQRLRDVLGTFATADAYQELRDLQDYLRTQENAQFYLYFCDLKFRNHTYPLLYLPLRFEFNKENSELIFEFDPHLYVNKRALDYVLQELDRTTERHRLSPLDNRIFYLDEDARLVDEIKRVIDIIQSVLDVQPQVDIATARPQVATTATLRLSTSLYFAVFDRSDESLLNDYEALLTAINRDEQGVTALFESFVRGMILDEPARVIQEVEHSWSSLSIPERLVGASPVPLNEEQRKILLALRDPKCRFVTAYGPPGTGKSHTITAIAFDCILNGQTVLVLSDKQEALDVVENKLTATLQSVRVSEDVINPILRLGKTGGTYTKLLSQGAMERIRQHHRAAEAHAQTLTDEIEHTDRTLKGDVARTIELLSGIDLAEVEELHRLEDALGKRLPGAATALEAPSLATTVAALATQVTAALDSPALAPISQLYRTQFQGHTLAQLVQFMKLRASLHAIRDLARSHVSLALFRGLAPPQAPALEGFIVEYERLRMPVFGYLFRRRQLELLHSRFRATLRCTNTQDLHRKLAELRTVHQALLRIEGVLARLGLPINAAPLIYDELASGVEVTDDAEPIALALETAAALLPIASAEALGVPRFPTLSELLAALGQAARYGVLHHKLHGVLESLPPFDAVAAREGLERLHTQRMAAEIDRRFISFADTKYATAKALAAVIKAKQQFPTDTFRDLRDAFPCIIAGIREFAEYIPLKPDTFDVVIIDEASQVSVAQAFPALLRARKVVVLGDPKQFSNVKSANASIATNTTYLSDIRTFFQANIANTADRLQRLSQFDVKKSILEFFELVANYSIMLKKHFRGYQELIDFSSRYFYDNGLQAIKIRGKPLDEVIVFTLLEHDGRKDAYANVNSLEMETIRDYLDEHLEEEVKPTVGIITPFREQQQFLTRELFKSANAPRYEDELKLKIMTFDTCQGEERDIIYYSMVATSTQDKLNYIFPVDLENAADRVDEALKMQRLNVGFSRAKEAIHFVLSKPIDQYRGSIVRALQHYHALLEAGEPDPDKTDPASPMETKVLDWLIKTPFYQANRERIELVPQFPIGDYLKQLDPYYQQPAYRVDFLLRFRASEGVVSLIIEYDGFQEHFVEHGKIHAGNYRRYYRPEDVERQMTLESYGYKFVRLNRFNLGRDPVDTLSQRLYDRVAAANRVRDSGALERIREVANGLANKTAKVCSKCRQVKTLEEFFDAKLKSGVGGHGRVCMACKVPTASPATGARRGRSSYRKWRRRSW